jgi:hypothetical protein
MLLCYTVEYFSYIPPILVVWRRTTSQTGAFATGKSNKNVNQSLRLLLNIESRLKRYTFQQFGMTGKGGADTVQEGEREEKKRAQ